MLQVKNVGVSNETAFGVMKFCRLAEQNNSFPRIITIQVKLHFHTDVFAHLSEYYPVKNLASSDYAVF